jgi:2-C-methyl-D-erythritol 2,4-cyclodiphosphate synthase
MRIGFGNDIHRLELGQTLTLGGIDVPSDRGAVGHSDGDALLHAVTDALLGALAAGDIGSHFPDTDDRWKGAESRVFVAEAARLVSEAGCAVSNVDATISLERPKLQPFIEQMRLNLAEMLSVQVDRVSVKAKTAEGLGEIGNGLAVKAEAVVLLENIRD